MLSLCFLSNLSKMYKHLFQILENFCYSSTNPRVVTNLITIDRFIVSHFLCRIHCHKEFFPYFWFVFLLCKFSHFLEQLFIHFFYSVIMYFSDRGNEVGEIIPRNLDFRKFVQVRMRTLCPIMFSSGLHFMFL